VLGSHIEGTPNVVAEALSAGVPVLSTDVGDVDQLVGHGSEGFLTAPDDPSAFAKHLLELLADPPLRRSMGERGRRRMLDERAPARLLADTVGAWRAAGWDVG
jgi:glycosyltransferase involved in cell wall biosynthesis